MAALAARHVGHMPPEACNPAPVYTRHAEVLERLGVLADATRSGE